MTEAAWERYEWENKPWASWGEFQAAMNDMTTDERCQALTAWRKQRSSLVSTKQLQVSDAEEKK
jgi:hypothetical protein